LKYIFCRGVSKLPPHWFWPHEIRQCTTEPRILGPWLISESGKWGGTFVTYPTPGRVEFLLSTLWPEGRVVVAITPFGWVRRGNQCQIRFTRVMSAVIQHYSQQIHTGILVLVRAEGQED